MATRLYPNTKNIAVLERLCFVPAGTAELHRTIELPFKEAKAKLDEGFAECDEAEQTRRRQEHFRLSEAEWNANNDNPAVGTLDAFITFGWGRVQSPLCVDYSGGELDNDKIALILKDQGVNLNNVSIAELEGVHWC